MLLHYTSLSRTTMLTSLGTHPTVTSTKLHHHPSHHAQIFQHTVAKTELDATPLFSTNTHQARATLFVNISLLPRGGIVQVMRCHREAFDTTREEPLTGHLGGLGDVLALTRPEPRACQHTRHRLTQPPRGVHPNLLSALFVHRPLFYQ